MLWRSRIAIRKGDGALVLQMTPATRVSFLQRTALPASSLREDAADFDLRSFWGTLVPVTLLRFSSWGRDIGVRKLADLRVQVCIMHTRAIIVHVHTHTGVCMYA